ncbi:class I SAM-dependent methyltransferase [Candidatus Micrarchaeota archaeon]|jgi:2-polyprenyl-3-methyl-5-hydroxy-6-metoxy-1,4-benzoquinol methylase|nr:class I SAM-dependent methyltransferase [Candidatus Micrarchaeota archaeon]
MWPEEIGWTIEQLDMNWDKSYKVCLDIGCESINYRTKYQPWNQTFYNYLKFRNVEIRTMDMEPDFNPDYLQDITKPLKIKDKFDIVLATHLLEHVPILELNNTVKNIEKLVKKNSLLVLSIPHQYPHHAMPIDNGWRPVPKELVKIFNGKVLATKIIETEHKLKKYVGKPKSKSSCALLKY